MIILNVCVLCSMRVRKMEPLSFEESESRALLMKQWTRYKLHQHGQEMNTIHTAMLAQQVALQELRNESEELYQQAIQVTSPTSVVHACFNSVVTPIKYIFTLDRRYRISPIPWYSAIQGSRISKSLNMTGEYLLCFLVIFQMSSPFQMKFLSVRFYVVDLIGRMRGFIKFICMILWYNLANDGCK